NGDRGSVHDLSTDDGASEPGFQFLLDQAAQGTCAVDHVIATNSQVFFGSVGDFQSQLAVVQTIAQFIQHQINDLFDLFQTQGFEHDDIVHPVEEFGAAVHPEFLDDLLTDFPGNF